MRNLVFSCSIIAISAVRWGFALVTRPVVLNHAFVWRLLDACSGGRFKIFKVSSSVRWNYACYTIL
jgi:hypothetical protein